MKYPPLNEPLLQWQRDFSAHTYLISRHLERLDQSLEHVLRAGGMIDPVLTRAWRTLGADHRLELLIDPNAAELIVTLKENPGPARQNGFNRQLEDLMAAMLPTNIYTHRRVLPWKTMPRRMTFNGIRIDANGPLHNLGHPQIQAPRPERADFYQAQIEKAMRIISEISPEALSLIENFTTTIHLRENPSKTNYSSWSMHIGIGKITASNFGCIAADIEEVIDFLIHESIHNFLHLVEEHHGRFLENHAYAQTWINERVVASPWSGKMVDLGSYTHAIAVWYGLAAFWRLARGYRGEFARELSGARVEKMVRQAQEGFTKSQNVHLAAGQYFDYMNKDYLAFSLNYQSEICSSVIEGTLPA